MELAPLNTIFDLRYGHSLELNSLRQVEAPLGVNFASRTLTNNGISARVLTDREPAQAGEITVALGGNVLSSFVQPEPFVCGRDVMILAAKNPDMSLEEKLFYCYCIWENRYRFSYGRQANRTLGELVVPAHMPDWAASMRVPTADHLTNSIGDRIALSPHEEWKPFRVGDLFTIKSGSYVKTILKTPGETPEVSSSAAKNGLRRHISLEPNFDGGVISVARNGSVATAFYQPKPFFATDDVRVWTARKGSLNVWEGLFITCIIELEKFRYTYGRKWSIAHMRDTELRLPATPSGDPDWLFMEDFMKGLPFSAALQMKHAQ